MGVEPIAPIVQRSAASNGIQARVFGTHPRPTQDRLVPAEAEGLEASSERLATCVQDRLLIQPDDFPGETAGGGRNRGRVSPHNRPARRTPYSLLSQPTAPTSLARKTHASPPRFAVGRLAPQGSRRPETSAEHPAKHTRPRGPTHRVAGGRTSVSAPLGVRPEATGPTGRQSIRIGQQPLHFDRNTESVGGLLVCLAAVGGVGTRPAGGPLTRQVKNRTCGRRGGPTRRVGGVSFRIEWTGPRDLKVCHQERLPA